MQFIDLKAQYAVIKSQVQANINQVLEHGQFILGPEVKLLEAKLADFCQAKHAIVVASGSAALQVALHALEIGPGDEVITTPFTFFSTVSSILLAGAVPVLVDIQADTYNIDPARIEEKITNKTKAIMPVDLYGQCADYDSINAIAQQYGLKVIADAAQSFGSKQNNVCVGNLADITCTSFYPAKPLGTYGEGGACLTNNDELAKKLRQIHNLGQDGTYNHVCLGINARMDSLQAAVLLAKLEIYQTELENRQIIAEKYNNLLADQVQIPTIKPGNYSNYAIYTIQVKQREKLKAYLASQNIPIAIHYPMPVHQQLAFKKCLTITEKFTISENAAKSVLSLPMHAYLNNEQIDKITKAINHFYL